MKIRRALVAWIAVVFCFSLFLVDGQSSPAFGQEPYPTKPIELMLTQPAGGSSDTANRILAEFMKKKLGQPVVVINEPAGGGTKAAFTLKKAAADGYTLSTLGEGQLISNALLQQTPYQLGDFRAVASVYNIDNVLVVSPQSPWKTVKELVQYARSNPGVKFASQQRGSATWFRGMFLAREAQIKLIGVPFQGDAGVASALMGNHVSLGVMGWGGAKPLSDGGKLRIIMTFTPGGIKADPKIPQLKEVLGKASEIPAPVAPIWAPAKTPDFVVKKLSRTIKEISADPEYLSKMKGLGIDVQYMDDEECLKSFSNVAKIFKEILSADIGRDK